MSAEEVLLKHEQSALEESGYVSRVVGNRGLNPKKKRFGAAIAITIALVGILIYFNSGSLMTSWIADIFIEMMDVQYADSVASRLLIIQQSLRDGDIPDNTTALLKKHSPSVLVGYLQDGEFIEENKSTQSLVLKMNDKIITADDFVDAVYNDAQLYDAIDSATYKRAAYYFDETGEKVFRRLGTNRNNYTKDSSFEEVMGKLIGEGSDVNVNSVALMEKEVEENGEIKKITYYDTIGANVDSKNATAIDFITAVGNKNTAEDSNVATLNAAYTMNIADTISKEQRSSLFFLGFMENTSKMKAGEGNSAKVPEAMNYAYRQEETEVVDIDTQEIIKVQGSMMESPSMYAVLSGERIDANKVKNYASDRVLKTVENRIGAKANNETLSGAVTSTNLKIKGTVGRYINGGVEASNETLALIAPTVSSSLVDNSFNDIKGINAGEIFVEGAVNVGRALAQAGGATSGDAEAVRTYNKLNSKILALDATIDRMNRSPFDITSRNTFLGSIVYKMAISVNRSGSFLNRFSTMSRMVASSIGALLPTTHADDEADAYLTNFGDCETIERIGAVGSVGCSMIATYDTSTLQDIFNDPGFVAFVEANTTLKNGVRTINQDSVLANFIKYNNERQTPLGITDGGILNAIVNNDQSVGFASDILIMVENFLGASEDNKRIASGEAFVNSSSNNDWQTYKYAQRYVSLARAAAALRQFDNGNNAYSNIKFFEGNENPVIAFLNNYYNIAKN